MKTKLSNEEKAQLIANGLVCFYNKETCEKKELKAKLKSLGVGVSYFSILLSALEEVGLIATTYKEFVAVFPDGGKVLDALSIYDRKLAETLEGYNKVKAFNAKQEAKTITLTMEIVEEWLDKKGLKAVSKDSIVLEAPKKGETLKVVREEIYVGK